VAAWLLGYEHSAIALGVMAVILIAKHHENIGRLLNGTESRIGAKK
jgi:glycerol-3-phosphate acyltransferase PlsY